ncbi:MAG: DUF2065 domain-containing protein [Gammaproteobacteria bacterium]|nr:DUF2065 domain-containing protein [Gammaproteobacteria bacterium]NND39002.1 DUF2065 domain-containing protein [Pseudomonadales bacterium]MBT8152154.1 DUF2065 domain-containing protein [Gammaproteobacteria bacterium]NNL11449.1 DUF2065 domain-containing protein [Pseudomonadales bacterium]NNM11990.1 DUF2065 domain-containing protein [Pseudomonadales bacterium]
MFQELIVAACLVLVIEGVLPFLSPSTWREALGSLATLSDRQIRFTGLSSMLLGVALLYFFN